MSSEDRLFAPVDIEALFQRRRSDRVDLDDAVTGLSLAAGAPVAAKVRNLSSAGFMAECPCLVQIGSFVCLDLPGIGEVQAQVRWQIGAKVGGAFLEPISLSQCEWISNPN